MKNKTYHLTINNQSFTITLTPPPHWGYCSKCNSEKGLRIVSEKRIGQLVYEEKKFCWSCALTNLDESEQSDYEFENKKEVIKEIRLALLPGSTGEESQELLDCYE